MSGTELAMERMGLDKGGKGGLIVNTASLAGIVPGWNRESYSYFASKHAVVSLTRSLGVSACVFSLFLHLFSLELSGLQRDRCEGSMHLSIFR